MHAWMVSRLKEESLYKYVEDFLINQLECFATFQKIGTVFTGYADVIGIKDIGGRTSGDFEVIAVEVKKSTYRFAANLGQALGYSLLAHRCYLATHLKESYTSEQEQMATHLGVGLISIYGKECEEICSSPRHQPIRSLMLKTLENADYGICNFCGNLVSVKKGWTRNITQGIEKGYLFYYPKKLSDRRVLFSQQEKPSKWVYVCGDCIKHLKLTGS